MSSSHSNRIINEIDVEAFRAITHYGQSAIRISLCINGLAAITTIIAVVFRNHFPAAYLNGMIGALGLFGYGLMAGGLMSLSAYISQRIFVTNIKIEEKYGKLVRIFTILIGFSSYLLFLMGLMEVEVALSELIH